MICPICDENFETEKDFLDGWCLMEEWGNCPKKHYFYHYATGYTMVTIGGKEYQVNDYNEAEHGIYYLLQRQMAKIHIALMRARIK